MGNTHTHRQSCSFYRLATKKVYTIEWKPENKIKIKKDQLLCSFESVFYVAQANLHFTITEDDPEDGTLLPLPPKGQDNRLMLQHQKRTSLVHFLPWSVSFWKF